MPSKYAVSVSLTEHLCQFVEGQVASGRYRTASEVIREALRLLETQSSGPPTTEPGLAGSTDAAVPSDSRHGDRGLHARTERSAL